MEQINVYENCPVLENEKFRLRLITKADATDLLQVYSDKNALPFFNSDNCHGDNFYYPSRERMEQAVDFWCEAYQKGWFVRWTVIDRQEDKAVGSVEMFHRTAEDAFDGVGVLRLDVGSSYEKKEVLGELFGIIIPPAYELFGCDEIITKIPVYAVERAAAAAEFGWKESKALMISQDGGFAYNGYWTIRKG